jgi:hypothetical protein
MLRTDPAALDRVDEMGKPRVPAGRVPGISLRRRALESILATALFLSFTTPAVAAPTAFRIVFPLHVGGHRIEEPSRLPTAAEIRAEKRLRLTRYGLQLADAIVSAIGYRAYARCLSCLAYPGGGPLGSAPVSAGTLSGDRPAESDPLIQPFSRGGILSLALGTLAYDFADARIEKHWPVERRAAADLIEIGAHAWGISSWIPELKNIHRTTTIAAACGTQWQAKSYGQAFSDGCVNAYYRAGGPHAQPASGTPVFPVCAPPQFKPGAYLFATPGGYFIATGTPCDNLRSPFP